MTTRVRLVGEEELEGLLPVAKRFLRETGYTGLFEDEQFLANWSFQLRSLYGCIFVREKEVDGKYVQDAWLGGSFGKDPNNGRLMFIEAFFFSETPGAGVRLLRFAEEKLRKSGVWKIMVAAFPGTKPSRLYEKLGYRQENVCFSRTLVE